MNLAYKSNWKSNKSNKYKSKTLPSSYLGFVSFGVESGMKGFGRRLGLFLALRLLSFFSVCYWRCFDCYDFSFFSISTDTQIYSLLFSFVFSFKSFRSFHVYNKPYTRSISRIRIHRIYNGATFTIENTKSIIYSQ